MSGTESVRVEHVDREAALKCLLFQRDYSDNFRQEMLRGERDASMTVQAFAWHRLAAIEAATEAAGWQPIETAPKNEAGEFLGPDILIYYTVNGLPWPAYWGPSADSRVDGAWIGHDDDCREFSTEHVTHWMPLPAAPNLEPRHD